LRLEVVANQEDGYRGWGTEGNDGARREWFSAGVDEIEASWNARCENDADRGVEKLKRGPEKRHGERNDEEKAADGRRTAFA
jgi:hypothetical protein